MNSRERMMIALENGRPDRLPCQVHGWMDYYLDKYLDGMDWFQAYEKFDMDFAIYMSPEYHYDEKDLANYKGTRRDTGKDADGNGTWSSEVVTPKGTLTSAGAYNQITSWLTEHPIKSKNDFEIWNEFLPLPIRADFTKIEQAKAKLGDRGIIRSHPFSFGQGSPWQGLCIQMGTEESILMAYDDPEFTHRAMSELVKKTVKVTSELWCGIPSDMVELGGGAGSSTVISPSMFEEFCLPYDRQQIDAMHEVGVKVVYHLCGGLMPMLDLVAQTGADGLETMTPPSMGGDCDLREASRQVGDKLFFIGGFDQNAGFEHGTPENARKQVFDCFEATKDHAGFIIAPSDHFFHGDPNNIQAFVDACKECVY